MKNTLSMPGLALPVDSVKEYFQHFSVLELDFTFYRPLLEADGKPSTNLTVLEEYAGHAPEGARFYLKAPQAFVARKFPRGGPKPGYKSNPEYLDAAGFKRRFLEPAQDVLGARLLGIIFEQEHQRVQDSPSPEENVGALDIFFQAVQDETPYHLELRSPHLLQGPYFDWLESRGLGHVFSHWTYLPMIRDQWKLSGGRITAANGTAVTRLLTPPKVRYEDAYAMTYPFDAVNPEMANARWARDMILDVTALVFQAMERDDMIDIIANNRAYGNAPDLNKAIARRVLQEEEMRSR